MASPQGGVLCYLLRDASGVESWRRKGVIPFGYGNLTTGRIAGVFAQAVPQGGHEGPHSAHRAQEALVHAAKRVAAPEEAEGDPQGPPGAAAP